jgi:hypothetical protein
MSIMGGKKMTANKADIDVIITAVPVSPTYPHGVKFALQTGLLKGNELEFRNNHKDGFDLRFNIVDPDGTGYLFPDDEKEAMWVKTVNLPTDPCPDQPPASYWPNEFYAEGVVSNNRTLKVRNENNPPAQLFKFSLWFTKTPNLPGTCICFDPIGDNQNGAKTLASQALAIAVIVVVVVAAAATKLLRLW